MKSYFEVQKTISFPKLDYQISSLINLILAVLCDALCHPLFKVTSKSWMYWLVEDKYDCVWDTKTLLVELAST